MKTEQDNFSEKSKEKISYKTRCKLCNNRKDSEWSKFCTNCKYRYLKENHNKDLVELHAMFEIAVIFSIGIVWCIFIMITL